MQELSPVQVRKFTTLFEHYDRNHNQFLSVNDFLGFADIAAEVFGWREQDPDLYETRLEVLRQNCQDMFLRLIRQADTNHDGQVSLPEYLAYVQRQALECKNMGTAAPWVRLATHQFKLLLDQDASGTIDLKEYQQLLRVLGSDADAASAFAKMDRDGDGSLSMADIEKLALEFILSDDPEAPGNLLYCGKF
jgi:Ca2+-binding EF-hand superfamily protein